MPGFGVPKGEFGIAGRRYIRKDALTAIRTHRMHAFEADRLESERPWPFRDCMIAHPVIWHSHGKLKRQMAERYPCNIPAYTDGMGLFVKVHEAETLL